VMEGSMLYWAVTARTRKKAMESAGEESILNLNIVCYIKN